MKTPKFEKRLYLIWLMKFKIKDEENDGSRPLITQTNLLVRFSLSSSNMMLKKLVCA
jgi:hypothetical protein